MASLGSDLNKYLLESKGGQIKSDSTWSFKSLLNVKNAGFGSRVEEQGDFESASVSNSNGWFSEAQKDPCLPSLTKKQRVIGFIGCLLMGTFCLSLASLYIPFLLLKARKFALLYTLGSLFIISSFAFLWGPMNHLKQLFSTSRLPFSTIYFGAMFLTLYFSIWMKSTFLTICFAVIQIGALVWYIISYIPGGQTGLKFFTKLFYSAASTTVNKTLPV